MLNLVLLLVNMANLFTIPLDCLKGAIRDAISKQCRCNTQEAVAALDVLFEEGEWFAWLDSLHPQAYFTEFNGHGVDIYAVDAAADDITQSFAAGFGRGLLFTCANGCQPFGNTVCRCNQEVAAATGGVADLVIEDSSVRIWLSAGFLQNGIEGRVEQAGNQAGGCVVTARGFAFVPASGLEFKPGGVNVQHGVQFQE